MSYHSEEKHGSMRQSLEREILQWPNVSQRLIFGYPAYLVNGRLFAFLVDEGVVVTQLSKQQRSHAKQLFAAEPFQIDQQPISRWLRLSVPGGDITSSNLRRLLRFIRYSYESVSMV